jgi:hypothetical protein
MEKYAIVFGSDMYIGTNEILTVEIQNRLIDFFRIRKIFRERSFGLCLTCLKYVRSLDIHLDCLSSQ